MNAPKKVSKKRAVAKKGLLKGTAQDNSLRMEGPIAEKDEVKAAERRTQNAQKKADQF